MRSFRIQSQKNNFANSTNWMKMNKINEVFNSANSRFFGDAYGLLSSRKFASMGTWRNDLLSIDGCGIKDYWGVINLRASSPGQGVWERGEKRKESLQLHLWNLNSTSNSPVDPRRLSRQISPNQREAETNANVNKHWKTRAKGNDVISYVISANQHFASTFSMQILNIPET